MTCMSLWSVQRNCLKKAGGVRRVFCFSAGFMCNVWTKCSQLQCNFFQELVLIICIVDGDIHLPHQLCCATLGILYGWQWNVTEQQQHSECIVLFPLPSGYVKAPHCCVICTLLVLFCSTLLVWKWLSKVETSDKLFNNNNNNNNNNNKGKVLPRTGHEGPEGELKYGSTLPLTSAIDGVGGQPHAPAALSPGKTRYPLYRRLGGPQGRSGRVRKISTSLGFDPRTVQPVASRYTDWAIAAPKFRIDEFR